LYTWIPSRRITAAASSVGAVNRMSIVFSDVPASLPLIPLFPSSAIAVDKSSMGTWFAANTAPAICIPIAMSVTSTLEEFAAAASISATRPASLAFSPNVFSALAEISAACATLSPPAAARSSVPPMLASTWSVDRPAFASSSIPSAASPAENDVSAPSSSAASCIDCICSAVAPAITCN
jgi:hypothetical protein